MKGKWETAALRFATMLTRLGKWYWSKPFFSRVLLGISASAALSLILNGLLFAFINWYVMSPIGYGGLTMLWCFTFPLMLLGMALPAVPGSMILLFFKKTRKAALIVLLASIVYFVVGMPALRFGRAVRMAGFERLAERSAGLVLAIKGFEKKHGRPPSTLDELVPDFLSAVPSAGMPAYPDWEYVTGETAQEYYNNPWVVRMSCGSGGINFDQFLYFPRQNYPEEGYGGRLERAADWAYVHE